MDFSKIVFRRKFALTHYKDLQLPLSEMSFAKDFVNDDRGDPYPVLYKSETCVEEVKNNRYAVLAGSVCRCQILHADLLNGDVHQGTELLH